ncbi:MAG: hypothetical protein JNJ49_10630 [Bdellovibrionaceae bacterium]|nr:hypothetical protein [Pseudobdellovibrionaceae bacterium]
MKIIVAMFTTLVTLSACAPAKNNEFLKPISETEAIRLKGYKQTLTCYGRLTSSMDSDPEVLAVAVHHPLPETVAQTGDIDVLTVNKLMPRLSETVSTMSRTMIYTGNIDSVSVTESAVTRSPLRTYKSGAVTVAYDPVFNRMSLVIGEAPNAKTYRIDCQTKQATEIKQEME